MISKEEARSLWAEARSGFLTVDAAIMKILAAGPGAWTAIGYKTFAEAWAGELGDIMVARETLPHVVYQAYREGFDEDFVMANIKGAGPVAATELKRQRESGVPAGAASLTPPRRKPEPDDDVTIVREHERLKPAAREWLHLRVGEVMLREYTRLAKPYRSTAQDMALEFVREGFKSLAAAKGKARAS